MSELGYKIGSSTGTALEPEQVLKFLAISNQEGLKNTLDASQQNSDLVSGVYEGGLKVWEASLDLVDYIQANKHEFAGKSIIELGCGQGLPGIQCLKESAAEVVFQDYNQEVLTNATAKVI